MAIESPIDISNEQKLKEQRSRQIRPSDCDKSEKSSKKYMLVMLIIAIFTSTLYISSVYLGSSAIISVRYNFKNVNVTPEKTIPVNRYGLYASPTNATFTPLFVYIGFLYPKTDPIFHTEYNYIQYPDNILTSEMVALISGVEEPDDYFFASSFHYINTTHDTTVKLRMSADYTVLFKVIVSVDFTDVNVNDTTISFVYIQGQIQDALGKPLGICTFDLTNTYTLALNITGLGYNYDEAKNYFRGVQSSYPFYINATLTNSYNWNNYWGVK